MKQKMLKLIKILNQFTIDDVLTMGEFSENEAKNIFTEFEDVGLIKKISEDEYLYIPEVNKLPIKPKDTITTAEEIQTTETKALPAIDFIH